jgi:hypothetical protein
MRLPRIVFVLGKGGVGRTTVSAALGLALAARGERVLVFEWTVADPIAPWFGLPPVGPQPAEVAPGLAVANYDLDEALRAYFVDHLRLRLFYRRIVHGRHVRRLIRAAPGIAEMLFLGQLWWLTTLAEREAGLRFDRIVVDAPATGHGASLLDLPATLSGMGAGGMLGLEIRRVVEMMSDPEWTGAMVVALPEELAIDETRELVPRVTERLRRAPLAALVNRSVTRWVAADGASGALLALGQRLSPEARGGLELLHEELSARARREGELRGLLSGATREGTISIDEQLAARGLQSPGDVVRAVAQRLAALEPGSP